ncbi:GntR family transcriptional regulator [Marinomonas sp. A79]|uniref:GntR family transcriptional regulator n=1 Tax=Marinomonas vulgaris TaxID=2823372 RepID=A0ABS5H9P2_9GAMM|nr:GntR family transcriptional regulator [Marinomonas vulgaris]MBR7888093.1 GntR family transcriptional regulator [Marinomonas vulgaris]
MADFLYKGVVDWFLGQMSQDALVAGDRMPSLRALSKQLGLSLNTIIHGYELLSEEGWIESRPKSGYFVCHRSGNKPALLLAGESLHTLPGQGTQTAWASLAHHMALVDQGDVLLSPISSSDDSFLPVLGKGHLATRDQVSEYLKSVSIKTHAAKLWLGNSPLAMFTQSVQTLTQRGDQVLVLSPCDPRITTTLQSLGRQVVTLSAGERGVDLDLAITCLREQPIRLLVLPGQFSFPTGQLISNLSLRRWIAIIEEAALPVIEWDLCSHLAYRSSPMMTYKSLDTADQIVYIGGVESQTSGRSAAWCLPARYHDELDGAFLGADMALNEGQQATLCDALQLNSKRSITRRARDVWANAERIKSHLETRLGDRVSFAASKGGMALWMRLSSPLDSTKMTTLLGTFRHAIVPGTLVSHEKDANHWLAVNVTLNDVEPLAKALAEHLKIQDANAPASDELDEAETIAESALKSAVQSDLAAEPVAEKTKKASRQITTEPLYNPMLDLISHDFG